MACRASSATSSPGKKPESVATTTFDTTEAPPAGLRRRSPPRRRLRPARSQQIRARSCASSSCRCRASALRGRDEPRHRRASATRQPRRSPSSPMSRLLLPRHRWNRLPSRPAPRPRQPPAATPPPGAPAPVAVTPPAPQMPPQADDAAQASGDGLLGDVTGFRAPDSGEMDPDARRAGRGRPSNACRRPGMRRRYRRIWRFR